LGASARSCRRERDPQAVAWFERQRTADLFLSVISIGEIERGIARQRASGVRWRACGLAGSDTDALRRAHRSVRTAVGTALGCVERRARTAPIS